MMNISIEIPSYEDMNVEWTIIGGGSFKERVCDFMLEQFNSMPSYVFPSLDEFLLALKSNAYVGPPVVVLGSSFRYEMASIIFEELAGFEINRCFVFYDLSPYIHHSEEWSAYYFDSCHSDKYIVVVDSYYKSHCKIWLDTLLREVHGIGIDVVVIHPWQRYQYKLFDGAISIIVWNGAVPYLHDNLNVKLNSGGYSYFYAECGFFPQDKYFYLDKCGINMKRSMIDDDLDWVSTEHYKRLGEVAREFFMDVKPACFQFDYVFCPLQVPDDTNVINNSRFKNGMQEFIDYINEFYKGSCLRVVFKPHPKDPRSECYVYGDSIVSNLESRTLILGASRVHGINSTVLFEAALAEKEVYVEGESLLKHKVGDLKKILAALFCSQSSIFEINSEYLRLVTSKGNV